MAQADILLSGQGISRRWGGLSALDDVSIDVARGSVHAVIGTNGAGKSTLARLLTGSFANDLLQRVNVPVEVIAGGKPGLLVRIGLPAGLGVGLATLLLAVD